MTLQFKCESCGQLLRVDESVAGRQVRCPKCKVVVSVPAPAPSVGSSLGDSRYAKHLIVGGICLVVLVMVGTLIWLYRGTKHNREQQVLREEVQRLVDEAGALAKKRDNAAAASARYEAALIKAGGLDKPDVSASIRQEIDKLKPMAAQKVAEEERKRKQVEAEQKRRAEEQKKREEAARLAQQRKREEEERKRKEREKGITIALADKGFREGSFESGDISDKILLSFKFVNHLPKDLRAFTGTVMFMDLFDREIHRVGLTVEDPVKSGQGLQWDGTVDYNQFIDSHRRLRTIERQNLKVSFKLEAVIYRDGTSQKFGE